MEKRLLRPDEVAEVLGIGRTKTYEMLRRGELPAIRIGRSVRTPIQALDAWLAAQQTAGGHE